MGGVTPQGEGRYPGYDVLAQSSHWDAETRAVVLARVEQVPPIRFFTAAEAATLGAFCDVVLAQDAEPKIPVLNFVDQKLHDGKLDGFRYVDMPDDRETWRLVARGLDEVARARGSEGGFASAEHEIQRGIVGAFAKGELLGGVWESLPCSKAWGVVMRAVLAAFYSHPWAWNEIGFGGPAYPRGYARFGVGQREWWEGAEVGDADPVQEEGTSGPKGSSGREHTGGGL